VNEFTQAGAATPSETTVMPVEPAATGHAPTFSELVYAHYEWWRACRRGAADAATTATYHDTLAAFELRHGEIVSAYWCSRVESAVALTCKKRNPPWVRAVSTFHRESDWATQNAPDIARELHRCDQLAVLAKTVLTGVRQLIGMQLVMASASHLLSLVDARAAHEDAQETATTLEHEQEELNQVDAYYREAANLQAQLAYFIGMAVVTVVLGIGAAIWLTIDSNIAVSATMAGALGAVVSVIQRINTGTFTCDYDVGRPYSMFLGGLRPLIGGAFALMIYFVFTSGLLHLPIAKNETPNHQHVALIVLGFLAGFSERWAQDTLAAVAPAASGPERSAKEDDSTARA
jgi:hypothetical protein